MYFVVLAVLLPGNQFSLAAIKTLKMEKKTKTLLWGLVALFAVLMSIPFLIPHCGWTALFGIVPLLCMDKIASESGVRRVWIYHYSAFVLWNAFTTFWVCMATVGGGIFAVLANALQMSLIFGLFRYSKKYFTGSLPYIFLAAAWIAWERLYFGADISWPWLTLGNSFARTTSMVQWYEWTGSLGGSLWVWASNLAIFGMMSAMADGRWSFWNGKAKAAAVSGTLAVLFVPMIVSLVLYNNYEETDEPLQVAILQPNIDPYQKFGGMTRDEQNALLEWQIRKVMDARADSSEVLLVAPETFTGDILINDLSRSRTWRRFRTVLGDYPQANLLFGASARESFGGGARPSHTAREWDGEWFESRNSALLMDASGRTDIYHKTKLVVGVEKTPYPAFFCKVDDLLGGVMGRNVGQDRPSVLTTSGGVPLGCAVCYESVYGDYCRGYVLAGAEAMTVITNDAWWGDTPGYMQHLSYSSLRAIELRRDIARCGNTGVSAIINQRGDIVSRTPWWEQAELCGEINLNTAQTFFARTGDVTGRLCVFVAFFLLLSMFVRAFTGKGIYGK